MSRIALSSRAGAAATGTSRPREHCIRQQTHTSDTNLEHGAWRVGPNGVKTKFPGADAGSVQRGGRPLAGGGRLQIWKICLYGTKFARVKHNFFKAHSL